MKNQEKMFSAFSSTWINHLALTGIVIREGLTAASGSSSTEMPRSKLLVSEKVSISRTTQAEAAFFEPVIFSLHQACLFVEVSECNSFRFLEGLQCSKGLDYLFVNISSPSAETKIISGGPCFPIR